MHEGELVSLIGANGAGKTTTLKAITGIQPAAAGEIEFMGKSIKGQGPWDLVKQGLVMVPEGRGTFTRMTITENLQMGAFVRNDNAQIEADIDKVFAIFPRLKERRNQLAGTMSGGEQQMLAMGRALMARPKVLLLDEPSMGLSPIMVDKIFEVVNDIHQRGTTVLLVEQNASRALQLASRGYVMDSGEVTMSGDAKQLLNDPKVRAAYDRLGVRDEVERIGMPKYGVEFVSPDHDERSFVEFAEAWDKSMPYAWQVRRSEFDEILFRNAGAKGARTLEGYRVRDVAFDADGATVQVELDDGARARPGAPASSSMPPAATRCSRTTSSARRRTRATTARRCTATSPAPNGCPASSRATSRSSGSTTAGSGSSRWPTARPASARCAGRTT